MKVNIDVLAIEVAGVTLNGKLTKAEAKEVVRDIFFTIAENVAEGHEVNVPGFGKFRRKESKERTGRNPKTGEDITIPAKKSPAFLPAKDFKQAVKDA
jgi:DNA-binding protein HU-beta